MKLVWKGKLNPDNLSKSKIPENAVYFYHSKFKFEAYIAIIPITILGLALLFLKVKFISHGLEFSYLGKHLGGILSILFLTIHELLHAIAFPAKAKIELFYCKAGLGVITAYPTSKRRYIFAVFLPSLVLGVIPFIVWLFIPRDYVMLNSILYVFSFGNLCVSTVDFNTIVHAIIEVPERAVIQSSGIDSFWYIPN